MNEQATSQQAAAQPLADWSSYRLETLRASVENVLQPLRAAYWLKGVRLVEQLGEGDLYVLADPDQTQRLIWNLLAKALEVTPAWGSVTLRVARRSTGDASVEVVDGGGRKEERSLVLKLNPWSAGTR